MVFQKRITIITIRRPEKNINQQLQWFGISLGLFNLRDKDKSCFRVFVELLKAAKHQTPLRSDEIAQRLGLTRGTVIHHINRLMESGIVVQQRNGYMLRVSNLRDLIEEIEEDIDRSCRELKEVADDIDRWIGL